MKSLAEQMASLASNSESAFLDSVELMCLYVMADIEAAARDGHSTLNIMPAKFIDGSTSTWTATTEATKRCVVLLLNYLKREGFLIERLGTREFMVSWSALRTTEGLSAETAKTTTA